MKNLVLFTLAAMCLVMFTAPAVADAQQVPPEEQNPWKCYDIYGWERPCTVTEELEMCFWAADDAEMQCMQRAGDDLVDQGICSAKRTTDDLACWAALIAHFWFV